MATLGILFNKLYMTKEPQVADVLPNITIKKKLMNEGMGMGEYHLFNVYETTTDPHGVEMTSHLGEMTENQIREQVVAFTKQKNFWEYILGECLKQ